MSNLDFLIATPIVVGLFVYFIFETYRHFKALEKRDYKDVSRKD
jgi:hypothetical protein